MLASSPEVSALRNSLFCQSSQLEKCRPWYQSVWSSNPVPTMLWACDKYMLKTWVTQSCHTWSLSHWTQDSGKSMQWGFVCSIKYMSKNQGWSVRTEEGSVQRKKATGKAQQRGRDRLLRKLINVGSSHLHRCLPRPIPHFMFMTSYCVL